MKSASALIASILMSISVCKSSAQVPVQQPSSESTRSWEVFGSERIRVESWNWFPTDKADGKYTYLGSIMRLGVRQNTGREEWLFEGAMPMLGGLPTRATAGAPQGALGLGANYYSQNHSQIATGFLKQAYIQWKHAGDKNTRIKLGRFEFSDGSESSSADASVSWLNANRISQRLVAPFGFSHVGRSFDGAIADHTDVRPSGTDRETLMAAFPTRGVFDLNGWDTLDQIPIVYSSLSHSEATKHTAGVSRAFAILYSDSRSTLKADNRPLAARTADGSQIQIATLGGNLIRTMESSIGKLDIVVWGAGQAGNWGLQHHSAFAADAEIGWQPKSLAWKPWIRAGYAYASGSGSTVSGRHSTFFPILPTPRMYARDPFYTEANLIDTFAQVLVKPCAKLTLRPEMHVLNLADNHDLWYSGGGAFDNSVFGYSGRPSNGHSGLGTLWDISADYQFNRSISASFYLGCNSGGAVQKSIYKNANETFMLAELNCKF